jgi:hypothetical protein
MERAVSAARQRVLVVAGLVGLWLPASARQTDRADLVTGLNDSSPHFASLALSDPQFFSFSSAFSWQTAMADFLPATPPAGTTPRRTAATSAATDAKDSKEVSDVARRNLLDYVHGEIGFLYGRSIGRASGDVEQGYVIGTVGDDRFRITAGAAYENSSIKWPRR